MTQLIQLRAKGGIVLKLLYETDAAKMQSIKRTFLMHSYP